MPPVETVDNVPAQPAMNNLLGPEVRGGISLVDGVRERLLSVFCITTVFNINDDGRKGRCRKGKMGEGISSLTTKSMNINT